MARKPVLFVLLLTVIGAGPIGTADAAPPVIIKILARDEVVDLDGNQTTILHAEKLATNESAAHNIAQYTLEFSESMETAEILEAFTRKADGKILEVDRSRIFPQAPPGSPQVPKFTDRKQKVVVFPNVTAGDMVVYTVRRTTKPFFPGQFFGGGFFQRDFAFEDARINITLPKRMAARVEATGVEHRIAEGGETTTHTFFYANPRPPTAEATGLSPWDTDPQFIISTFADYAAVAAAYRALAAPKTEVTPRLQALADDITAGASDRREQAHRIYDWVSEHIRYVAVFLGNGGYEPHDATSILDSGYGDCKDHVVLLEALLKAKGIQSIPVLINSGNRYRAPEAATAALFNHVLSYLPEFDLYVDSTVGVAPFGTLPADEYGKPVARATETDASLITLPLVAAQDNEETLETTGTLMPDGTVSGRSLTTASGPFGVRLRQLASSIEGRGQTQWAETYFKNIGWHGKASFQFDPPRSRPAPVYVLSASFELEARQEFLDGKTFAPPEGIRMLVRPGEYLLGSWTLVKTAPTPCFSGHQVEKLSLTLPPGRDIELLPRGKTIENPYLVYQSNWQRDGQVVTVRREITVKLPVAVCRDEIRAQLAQAIAEIRGDYRSEIALKPLVQ
jgi:transglutaminase-like putative cysteine protease